MCVRGERAQPGDVAGVDVEAVRLVDDPRRVDGLVVSWKDWRQRRLPVQIAPERGVEVFNDEDAWDVLEDIPNDSAAALILLEHHWAVPLRDAIARAGGFRISDGFISPLDLVEIGLLSAEEAKELHAMEQSAAAAS